MEGRARAGDDASQADAAIAAAMAARADPWPEAHGTDTAGSPDDALHRLRERRGRVSPSAWG